MGTAAALVPWWLTVDDPHRAAAWDYVSARLSPQLPVYMGGAIRQGQWSKGAAVEYARDALRSAVARGAPDADVYVVHDADVVVHPEALTAAVEVVARGQAAWAVPHGTVRRLSEQRTALVLAGEAELETSRQFTRYPYTGIAGGGITVVRADVYEDCPIDARFLGWGAEDECWGWALNVLHGPPWRGDAALWHLWHPHPAPRSRHGTSKASHDLWLAYRHARRTPARMREVLNGALTRA